MIKFLIDYHEYKYNLELNGRINVVAGMSGTGKTRLYTLLSEAFNRVDAYEAEQLDSGHSNRFICSKKVIVAKSSDILEQVVSEYDFGLSNILVVLDDDFMGWEKEEWKRY